MRPEHKKALIYGTPIVLTIALVLIIIFSQRAETAREATKAPSEVAASVITVSRQPTEMTEDVPGTVVAIQHADLSTKVMSKISEVFVREGDHVQKGQLLARLEGKDLAINIQQAQATLESAQAQLAKTKQGPRPEQISQAEQGEQRAKSAYEQAIANLDLVKAGSRKQQKLQSDQSVLAAQQQITQAEAGVATARANLISAQADYERMDYLYKEGVVSRMQFEHATAQREASSQAVKQYEAVVSQARTGLEIAQAQSSMVYEGARTQEITAAEKQVEQASASYEQAKQDAVMAHQGGRKEDIALASAGISQAKSSLAGAQNMASYTSIYAPFSGVITARKADPGSMAMPQMSILSMDDDSLYQLMSSVPERLAVKLAPGTKVSIRLDSLNLTLPATVSEIVPSADAASHTLNAKIDLPASAGINTGLFGRLSVTTGTEPTIVIPASALLERKGLTGVYVVNEGGTAQFTLVTIGKRWDDRLQVLSGLQDGQRVVTTKVNNITAGQHIRAEGGAL